MRAATASADDASTVELFECGMHVLNSSSSFLVQGSARSIILLFRTCVLENRPNLMTRATNGRRWNSSVPRGRQSRPKGVGVVAGVLTFTAINSSGSAHHASAESHSCHRPEFWTNDAAVIARTAFLGRCNVSITVIGVFQVVSRALLEGFLTGTIILRSCWTCWTIVLTFSMIHRVAKKIEQQGGQTPPDICLSRLDQAD
jgi:hypothetical protein